MTCFGAFLAIILVTE